jgi:hypothetical protein
MTFRRYELLQMYNLTLTQLNLTSTQWYKTLDLVDHVGAYIWTALRVTVVLELEH